MNPYRMGVRVGGLLARRLEVMCVVLFVELIACMWFLLRVVTGEDLPLSSTAIAYIVVSLARPRFEDWIKCA